MKKTEKQLNKIELAQVLDSLFTQFYKRMESINAMAYFDLSTIMKQNILFKFTKASIIREQGNCDGVARMYIAIKRSNCDMYRDGERCLSTEETEMERDAYRRRQF